MNFPINPGIIKQSRQPMWRKERSGFRHIIRIRRPGEVFYYNEVLYQRCILIHSVRWIESDSENYSICDLDPQRSLYIQNNQSSLLLPAHKLPGQSATV